MLLHLHWYLPTSGDGRDIVGWVHSRIATAEPRPADRAPDIEYLTDVARAAERLGYGAVLTPTGTWCEDAWITTAALTRETRELKFIVAFRPDAIAPTLAAQMAATYQRVSRGRLLLNIVVGSDEDEQHRFGDWLDHDARYARASEFLTILRGAWSGTPFSFSGEHYKVADATVGAPPDPVPGIFLGGASAPAVETAAQHADVYVAWAEPPADIAKRIAYVRTRAAQRGRTIQYGLRVHVVTRDTPERAWAETTRMLEAIDERAIAVAQERFRGSTSIGQQRMTALQHGRTDNLEIYPNLWAGFGLVRRHAGTALVGSHEQVADRIEEYHSLGIDHIILSGQPHLEEAHWFAEGVIPVLRRRGLEIAEPGTGRTQRAASAEKGHP